MATCSACGAITDGAWLACPGCGALLETAGATKPVRDYSAAELTARAQHDAEERSGAENTSGMGAYAVVPLAIKSSWNWGAFFFTWIWGIAHKAWITFIVLATIPISVLAWEIAPFDRGTAIALRILASCIDLIIWIWLGVKGSELAWRNRHFEGGINEFWEVQRAWTRMGLILVAAPFVIGLLFLLVFLVFLRM
jgi:hypothetical protein